MDPESRIEEILGEWRALRDRGEAPDPESVVAAHPEIGEELRARFAALELLEGMLRQARLEGGAPPERIGDYRVLREIGRGGMGVVYEAEQEAMRRRVALKVLYPRITGSDKAAKRFQREARAAGRLHHTNIVPVYELGREGELWFYSMELVEGIALGELIRGIRQLAAPGLDGIADWEDETTPTPSSSSSLGTTPGTPEHYRHVARLFAGVAEALEAAHREGVIHRDLKPSNLILDQEGTLKVIDFGLARVLDEDASVTASGDRLGTPAYMSPEQARKKKVDQRSDIYSLGATLYELLTLRAPFRGDAATVIVQIPVRYPRAPRRIEPRIPRDLETIVQKAMEKEPGKRYASAEEMALDLRSFAEGDAVRARPIGPVGRTWRRMKRHKALSGLAALVLVLAIGGGMFAWTAQREGARRRALEYRMLCARAEAALVRSGEQRSELYLDLLQGETARELFDRAIALLPERPEAYLGRALVLGRTPEQRLGDIDAAETRGLSLRTVHLARAHVLERVGRRDEARREQEFAAVHAESSAADAFFEGRLLIAERQLPEGLALLTRAIRHSEEGSFHRYLALSYRAITREEMGDLEGALEDQVALRATGDESIGVRIRLASLWRRVGREGAAERLFEAVLGEVRRQENLESWQLLCGNCRESEADWREKSARSGLRVHPDAVPLLVELAQALGDQGRNDEAIVACQHILELRPAQVRALMVWGRALLAQGDHADALERFDAVLVIDPRDVIAHIDRGVALAELRRPADALAAFRRALEIDPGHVTAMANAAMALTVLGRHREAGELAERTLELEPDEVNNAIALFVRGCRLLREGRPGEALATLDRAGAKRPGLRDLQAVRGDCLAQLGRYEEALHSFDASIRQNPEHPGSWNGRATALTMLGKLDEARDSVARALALSDSFLPAHVLNADILRRMGRPAQALEAFDRGASILRANPAMEISKGDLHTIAEIRGSLLVDLGRFEEGLEALQEALQTDPDCVAVNHGIARALLNLGRPEEALAAADRTLRLNPGAVEARKARAVALLGLRRYEDALQEYARCVEMAPDRIDIQADRGELLYRLGRFEEAIDVYAECERASSVSSIGSDVLDHRVAIALARFETGQVAEALATVEGSVKLWNTSGDLHLIRARCLAWLGRWQEAEDAMARALELGFKSGGALVFAVEILRLRGNHAQALRAARRLYGRNPRKYGGILAASLRALERDEEAIAVAATHSAEPPVADILLSLAYLAAVPGDAERARMLLEHRPRPWHAFEAWLRARIHAVLGEEEEALRWLEHAVEQGFRWPEGAVPEPDFVQLEEDPRYLELMERAAR